MQVIYFKKEKTLRVKISIREGNLSTVFSIALLDKYGRDTLLYYKEKISENDNEKTIEIPIQETHNLEMILRCICDIKSLQPSRKSDYLISMEVFQNDKLLAEIEQKDEITYNQKCTMLFCKLICS